ncbi:Cold shock protein CspV [Streptomyces sp. PTY087I2]|nr:Cold shock protein CspV [Streptomyces sp. PTY087I2]
MFRLLMTGKILRFDEVRGYGFIAPDEGDEDVFMHANDLLEEKYLYQSGRRVEYFLESGDKGPKAGEIRLVRQAAAPASRALRSSAAARPAEHEEEGDCDILTAQDFQSEVTEALIEADGTLTAAQLQHVRQRLLRLAQAHGWVDSA